MKDTIISSTENTLVNIQKLERMGINEPYKAQKIEHIEELY